MFWKTQFDPERYAKELLASLPPCTPHVAVIDNTLDSTFDTAYVVPAEQMLAWFKTHLTRAASSVPKDRAASAAFLRWLGSPSNDYSGHVACVEPEFFRQYSDYASDLVKEVKGVCFCPTCDLAYPEVTTSFGPTVDEGGGWKLGLELWLCPRGHELRRAPYRFHIL